MTSRGIIQLVVIFASVAIVTSVNATGEASSTNNDNAVPIADDLTVLSLKSNQQKLPILIMYAAKDCEYCQRLEEDLLGPMYKSAQYRNRVIIRKVMIDGIGDIKDFNGKLTGVEDFVSKIGVQVTPTLQFVDASGKQLVPEMVGYNTPELYSAYVDNAISESQRAISVKVTR